MNITKGASFVLVEHFRIGDECKQVNVGCDEGRKGYKESNRQRERYHSWDAVLGRVVFEDPCLEWRDPRSTQHEPNTLLREGIPGRRKSQCLACKARVSLMPQKQPRSRVGNRGDHSYNSITKP